MQLKFCIAKMVGTAPVYQTDTVNTWVSDITDSTVEWYASEGAARNALQGPETFVVPFQYVDTTEQAKALQRACEAIQQAIDIGAVSEFSSILLITDKDVFEKAEIDVERENKSGCLSIFYGTLDSVEVSYSVMEVSK